MAPVQEANSDNLGKSFRFSTHDCMLNVLIRIASTYNSMIKYEKKIINYLFP